LRRNWLNASRTLRLKGSHDDGAWRKSIASSRIRIVRVMALAGRDRVTYPRDDADESCVSVALSQNHGSEALSISTAEAWEKEVMADPKVSNEALFRSCNH
jgi:hypothetical protein